MELKLIVTRHFSKLNTLEQKIGKNWNKNRSLRKEQPNKLITITISKKFQKLH